MEERPPKYSGKPTAYLEHQILDYLVKNGVDGVGSTLTEYLQIIYSEETLKEIHRSGDEHDHLFLGVLQDLGAYYLELVKDDEHLPTGDATIIACNPFDVYQVYLQNLRENPYSYLGFEYFLHKLNGGFSDIEFEELFEKPRAEFEVLLRQIELDNLDEPLSTRIVAYQKINDMRVEFNNNMDDFIATLKKDIPEQKNWSGVKDYRRVMELGPIQLNNIRPPNVIQKIWELYKEKPPYCELGLTLEQFYNIKSNPIFPDRELLPHDKIISLYQSLNLLGYFPDNKQHKPRRFEAAMSDQAHVSMAYFADFLVSNDKNLIKKAGAIYEYLNAKTRIMHLEGLNSSSSSQTTEK